MKTFIKIILTAFAVITGLAHGQTNFTPAPNIHSILQAPNYAAVRGLLDLEPGVDFLSISASNTAYQAKSSNLDLWAAVVPSNYLTTATASASYQPLSTNLNSWSAVVPSSYLTTSAASAGYQPLSSNLTSWASLSPASYSTTSAIAAAYQPLSANLTSWSAVAPSSYLNTAGIAAAYQPLSSNLTSWSAVSPSAYSNTSQIAAGYQPLDSDLTAIAGLTDPNADRILFWDDSVGAYRHMEIGSGLAVSGGTILTATGGSFDQAGSYTLSGAWDFTAATVTLGTLTVNTLNATNLQIGGVPVTSSAAELNVLDGVPAGLTATEVGYVDGVTSSIQTQLNSKAGTSAAIGTFGITIDGGGSAITTGIKGDVSIPYTCTINSVTLLADQSGSIVVDIWKDTYANYPPTNADSIAASALPTISAAIKATDSTLTGWNTTVNAGDTIRFNINSASTITRLTLIVKVTKL